MDSSDVTSTDDIRGTICSSYVPFTHRNDRYSLTSTDRLFEELQLRTIEEYKDFAGKISGLQPNQLKPNLQSDRSPSELASPAMEPFVCMTING